MVSSMTGYGRGDASGEGKTVTIEMKGVNHRFLEIALRLPRAYNLFEEKIKGIIKENLVRGRLDVFVNIEETGEKKRKLKVDKELALDYHNSLKELAQFLGLAENISVLEIARLPEVLTLEEPEEDCEALWPLVEEALRQALEQLRAMRQEEGRKLAADLLARKDIIAQLLEEVAQRSHLVVEEYREKLQNRIQEILGTFPVDENRLAMEVALVADRSNITEELVRLRSHLEQLSKTLEENGAVGRKLDFLVQEMHREINTIGSKSNDLIISQKVVALKSEVEKIREQVQNLE